MIDPSIIGNDPRPPQPITTYLKWDRYSALADYLMRLYGMEVPVNFTMPVVKSLKPVKWSVCDWPERTVIST